MSLVEKIIKDHIKQNLSQDIKLKLAHIIHQTLINSGNQIKNHYERIGEDETNQNLKENIINNEINGTKITNENVNHDLKNKYDLKNNQSYNENLKEIKDKENIMRFIENDQNKTSSLKMYSVPS